MGVDLDAREDEDTCARTLSSLAFPSTIGGVLSDGEDSSFHSNRGHSRTA
jgi:hypothetical protein